MFLDTIYKCVGWLIKSFEETIYRLMSKLMVCHCIIWYQGNLQFIVPIGNITFSIVQYQMKGIPWNILIISSTTRVWTIRPDDPSGYDIHGDPMLHSRAFEIVGVPQRTEWRRLLNVKVSSINSNENVTVGQGIIFPKLPVDLQTMICERWSTCLCLIML